MVSGRLELVVRTAKTSAISTEIRQFPTSVSGSMLNRIQSPDDVSTSKGVSCSTRAIVKTGSRNED
jgi:hypothetical protein